MANNNHMTHDTAIADNHMVTDHEVAVRKADWAITLFENRIAGNLANMADADLYRINLHRAHLRANLDRAIAAAA